MPLALQNKAGLVVVVVVVVVFKDVEECQDLWARHVAVACCMLLVVS